MAQTSGRRVAASDGGADPFTRSPDGESRGLLFRVGDVFPMSPTRHLLCAPATAASPARPWGLRFLAVPAVEAGKHEGKSKVTSAPSPDSVAPEEIGTD